MIDSLTALRDQALALEAEHAEALEQVPHPHRDCARNLLHYVAVRRHDLRPLQRRLHRMGLSSLGRMEPYVLASIQTSLGVLERLNPDAVEGCERPAEPPIRFDVGRRLLRAHADRLLGEAPDRHRVRVMVTMPSEAAERYELLRDLLAAGMGVMRINCAKDDPERWAAMIGHLQRARQELGRPCRIACDLAGPNARTGPVQAGPAVFRWQPRLDEEGRLIAPARVWLGSAGASPKKADAVLVLPQPMIDEARSGDLLEVVDTRDRLHVLRLRECEATGAIAEGLDHAFVQPGAPVRLRRGARLVHEGRAGSVPGELRARTIRVQAGDTLVLHTGAEPGQPALRDAGGNVVRAAGIGCNLSEVFAAVRPGERLVYDDGDTVGVVREATADGLVIEITYTAGDSAKIKAGKAVSFPDSRLELPSLTDKDLADLDFVARHADLLGHSFVRDRADIERLQHELDRRGAEGIGKILKIETREAFENLPRLLLTALRWPPVGVLIARGDMGVQLGFERMAELQEELLWLAEAAHIPVIWATQVLEGLAKTGLPSRAEVTDAAMAARAECVMLNKGEYIVETVHFLNDVIGRMQAHQDKKFAQLRKLGISESL